MKAAALCLVVGLALASSSALVLGQEEEGNNKPIVETHFGKLQGIAGVSRDGKMFYQFKGIPYAKAPERFQAPEIPDNWEGIKDASAFGPLCPQYHPKSKEFVGQEACLFLNVYTPKLPKEGLHKILLPVVVLLHPGLNNHGSGDALGPNYLMDEDVILVTLNSRLGPLGYLNTGDGAAQGNMGLKDQTFALKWIQGNIEKFGGDKARVTLMGSSAGGSDVVLHLFNPLSKGLFSGAVAQSGNPLAPIPEYFTRNPIAQAKKLAEKVGCPGEDSKALVQCLKGMDAMDILKKMGMLQPLEFNTDDYPHFGPSIEKVLEGQMETDVAISAMPFKLLSEGKLVNKVPLIMGLNDHDGLTARTAKVLNSTEAMKVLDEKWEEVGPKTLFYKESAKDALEVSKKIRDFYFGEKSIGLETREQILDLYTDRYFAGPVRFAGRKLAKHIPVYLYYFNHKPKMSALEVFGFPKEINQGAAHLDEMQYLVSLKDGLSKEDITKDGDEEEYTLSKGMVRLWASFFETGKPTRTWGEGKEWKKVEDEDKPRWYNINLATKMMDEPEKLTKRVQFWHDLYAEQLSSELASPKDDSFTN